MASRLGTARNWLRSPVGRRLAERSAANELPSSADLDAAARRIIRRMVDAADVPMHFGKVGSIQDFFAAMYSHFDGVSNRQKEIRLIELNREAHAMALKAALRHVGERDRERVAAVRSGMDFVASRSYLRLSANQHPLDDQNMHLTLKAVSHLGVGGRFSFARRYWNKHFQAFQELAIRTRPRF